MNISEQINVLGEKIDYISQNTQFTLSITIAVIGVSVAIAGVALYQLSKMWVEKGVREGLVKIKNELKNELDTEIKGYFKDNPKIKWAKGSYFLYDNNKEQTIKLNCIETKGSNPFKYILQASSHSNPDKRLDYIHKIENDEIVIKVFNYEQSCKGIDWTVIWINDEFHK